MPTYSELTHNDSDVSQHFRSHSCPLNVAVLLPTPGTALIHQKPLEPVSVDVPTSFPLALPLRHLLAIPRHASGPLEPSVGIPPTSDTSTSQNFEVPVRLVLSPEFHYSGLSPIFTFILRHSTSPTFRRIPRSANVVDPRVPSTPPLSVGTPLPTFGESRIPSGRRLVFPSYSFHSFSVILSLLLLPFCALYVASVYIYHLT